MVAADDAKAATDDAKALRTRIPLPTTVERTPGASPGSPKRQAAHHEPANRDQTEVMYD